jgi:hypothetical protein
LLLLLFKGTRLADREDFSEEDAVTDGLELLDFDVIVAVDEDETGCAVVAAAVAAFKAALADVTCCCSSFSFCFKSSTV